MNAPRDKCAKVKLWIKEVHIRDDRQFINFQEPEVCGMGGVKIGNTKAVFTLKILPDTQYVLNIGSLEAYNANI